MCRPSLSGGSVARVHDRAPTGKVREILSPSEGTAVPVVNGRDNEVRAQAASFGGRQPVGGGGMEGRGGRVPRTVHAGPGTSGDPSAQPSCATWRDPRVACGEEWPFAH